MLDYFPAACAAVAELSRIGNEQHNPGEEMHWARGKSSDHADCVVRHIMDRGTVDTDGVRHSTKAAWRALANLQEELEAAGAPLARGARPASGWLCPCGSTELWAGHTPQELAAIKRGAQAPVCNRPNCYEDMERVV